MAAASPILTEQTTANARLTDSHGRIIHDLRVSITDRCNYKCVYCRTGEVGAQYPELTIEEYLRLIKLFVDLGISKVRLTGGEPLLRARPCRAGAGTGSAAHHRRRAAGPGAHHQRAFARWARRAPEGRRTEPCDSEHGRRGPEIFEKITRVPGSFEAVLAGVRAARAAGLTPLKVNCVLLRGFNDNQIESFARFAREENVVVRFIEFMPLEEGRLWTPEIVVR
jgi:cyclic pyranopterin phosphate synthase